MNLLETILKSGNTAVVDSIAKKFNIDGGSAKTALALIVPALARGIQKNTSSQDGMMKLLGAINSGNHSKYIEDPSTLENDKTIEDGNSILGHIFGSKDVSRNVAGHAAQESGLDSAIVRKMLPIVAAVAMGALAKKSSGTSGFFGGSEAQTQPSSSAMGMFTQFLDADKDGSIVDDLLGMAKRFF